MNQQSEQTEVETTAITTPATWPGAFGIYRSSKEAIMFNWRTVVGLMLVGAAATMAMSIFDPSLMSMPGTLTASQMSTSAIVNIVEAVVSIFLSIGFIIIVLSNIKRVKVQLADVFKRSLGYFLNSILVAIVQAVIVFVSLLLFIIPFFFVMPRLMLASYFLVDKNMGPIEAIKASWSATRGNVGKVYGIIGATLLMALLMITIIGIPFSLYFLFMYSASYGLLYNYVTTKQAA